MSEQILNQRINELEKEVAQLTKETENRCPTLEMVKEFHQAFGHNVTETPFIESESLNNLRLNLIKEEYVELMEALALNDPIETFDALCDLQYVLDGAFLALGFHEAKMEGMKEVHRSNMSKLGNDGKPVYREDGKILKGPNFKEPDLRGVLEHVFSPKFIS